MPKEKNSAYCGDLVGRQRRARQLDHRAEQVVDLDARAPACTSSATGSSSLARDASARSRAPTSGIMISGRTSMPSCCDLDGGLEDRPDLHLARSRGTGCPGGSRGGRASGSLVQLRRPSAAAPPRPASALPVRARLGHLDQQLLVVRAGTRAAAGRAGGSSPGSRPSPRRCRRSRSRWNGSSSSSAAWRSPRPSARIISPHDRRAARSLEEHVLGAAEADALGAELARLRRRRAGVGVGPDLQRRGPRRPRPSASSKLAATWSARSVGDRAEDHLAGRAVDRDLRRPP